MIQVFTPMAAARLVEALPTPITRSTAALRAAASSRSLVRSIGAVHTQSRRVERSPPRERLPSQAPRLVLVGGDRQPDRSAVLEGSLQERRATLFSLVARVWEHATYCPNGRCGRRLCKARARKIDRKENDGSRRSARSGFIKRRSVPGRIQIVPVIAPSHDPARLKLRFWR